MLRVLLRSWVPENRNHGQPMAEAADLHPRGHRREDDAERVMHGSGEYVFLHTSGYNSAGRVPGPG
jgi:hypothetical protein